MVDTFRKLSDLLTPRERRWFYVLILLSMGVGVLETVGVASILPFMAVLGEPERIAENARLAWVYDRLGFTTTDSFLIFLGVCTFVVVITGILAHIFLLYAIGRFANMRAYTLSRTLLRAYLHQPYAWFLNRHSADLSKSVLSEVDSVVAHSFIPAMRLISSIFVALFITALLLVLQPAVAIGSATVLGLAYVAIYVGVRGMLRRLGDDRFGANALRYRIVNEATGGIKDVKLMGLEDTYLRRYEDPARRMARANAIKQLVGEAPRYLLQGVAFGGMLVAILALLLLGDGSLGSVLPILAVYAFAGLRLLPALQNAFHQVTVIRFGRPSLDALHRDMQEIRDAHGGRIRKTPPAAAPLPLRRALRLREVHFGYPAAERQALRGLDLTIPARSTVGLVGGTGAGKTTAVDLILGLLTPQQGAIEVDGVPITDANRRAWQNAIGYVPQQIFLTDESVAANIAFGLPREQIDMAAVERAARIAELHDFVTRDLPQGYDTLLGERGVRLSGGQRQRIGIARALYHDPEILIMDEATSALDNITERAVMDAVHNIGDAKTIILIAHRLSTVQECDVIFMLDQGTLAAQGTYAELLDSSTKFRAMAGGRPAH